jgi:hypothetical protein
MGCCARAKPLVREPEIPPPRHFQRIRARAVCHSGRFPTTSVRAHRGTSRSVISPRRGRFAFGFVAALSLVSAAVTAEPESVCAVNRVDGVLAVGGFVEVTGFAFEPGGAPVSKIQLTLDGSARVGEASLAGLRPDVLAHFNRPDYLWSGWSGRISLEKVSPGRHTVETTAYTHSGDAIPCGTREIQVIASATPPERSTLRIALEMLLRLFLFLGAVALLGLLPAVATGGGPTSLRAPFLGLALFGIAAEAGSRAGARPLASALVAAGLSLLLLFLPRVRRRLRPRRPAPGTPATLLCAVVFAAVGAAALSSHGEGVVLGDIDDAIRECAVADSLNRYGPTVPSDAVGYIGEMTRSARDAGLRPGGSYLLSALSGAFHSRAHAVHSVAMLGSGVLVILGAGLLGSRVLRRHPRWRWLPPALGALNSTLYATLANQHLGSLLFAALFLGFLFHLLALLRSRSPFAVVPAALLVAAAWTYYPEGIATWGLAGVLSLFVPVSRSRRSRTWWRLVGVAILSAALNPVGLVQGVRSLTKISGQAALSSPYAREIVGDTHYFPSLNVVAGIAAYREDAPAPTGRLRRFLVPLAGLLILVTCWAGWRTLGRGDRRLMGVLVLPVALALYANLRLNFPYGFAKYLPLAVPIWAVVFSRLASGAAEDRRQILGVGARTFAAVSLLLVGALTLPAVRHVVSRIVRTVPSYDPAYRALPALAATVGKAAVLFVDEPIRARLEWMKYFLGENRVASYSREAVKPTTTALLTPTGGSGEFLLVDRRKGGTGSGIVAASRDFFLVPVPKARP